MLTVRKQCDEEKMRTKVVCFYFGSLFRPHHIVRWIHFARKRQCEAREEKNHRYEIFICNGVNFGWVFWTDLKIISFDLNEEECARCGKSANTYSLAKLSHSLSICLFGCAKIELIKLCVCLLISPFAQTRPEFQSFNRVNRNSEEVRTTPTNCKQRPLSVICRFSLRPI